MAKTFYTERDIEDMARRGERTLVVTDDVVLTDLAYESARKLNVELVQPHDTPPGAPIRPYLNTDRRGICCSACRPCPPPHAWKPLNSA